MALSDRTRRINVVFSLKDMDSGSIFELKNELRSYLYGVKPIAWAFILHDLDEDENGELKTPHIHLYAEYPKVARLSTFLNSFSKALKLPTLAISIEKSVSMEGSIQYLIHKNAPEKYQYDACEIVTNIESEELELLFSRPVEAFNVDFIVECARRCRTRVDFIKAIGLERYRLYRNVIKDIVESLQ